MPLCSRVLCWRILQIYLWGQGQCKIYVLWRHVLRLLLQSVLLQRQLVSIELSCIFSGIRCHKPQVLERHPKFVKYVIRNEIDYIYSLSLSLSLSDVLFLCSLPHRTALYIGAVVGGVICVVLIIGIVVCCVYKGKTPVRRHRHVDGNPI